MAVRVKVDEVKALTNSSLDAGILDTHITTANTFVNELLDGQGYSEAMLKQIELYLAGHFATVRIPPVASNAGETFHGKSGMGLEFTPYGQQALALEYKGILKAKRAFGGADLGVMP